MSQKKIASWQYLWIKYHVINHISIRFAACISLHIIYMVPAKGKDLVFNIQNCICAKFGAFRLADVHWIPFKDTCWPRFQPLQEYTAISHSKSCDRTLVYSINQGMHTDSHLSSHPPSTDKSAVSFADGSTVSASGSYAKPSGSYGEMELWLGVWGSVSLLSSSIKCNKYIAK